MVHEAVLIHATGLGAPRSTSSRSVGLRRAERARAAAA
jgi:hypothetical protein